MRVLAIDTALDAAQAAVLEGDVVLALRSESMTRGHQERLAPMVQAVMAAAGLGFDALDRIGVTVGPGSFTGLRVGLAFAKGLSLARRLPCVGVGTLEALAASAGDGRVAAAVDARQERVYLQLFRDATALDDPGMLDIREAHLRIEALRCEGPVRIVGPGAVLLDAGTHAFGVPDPAALGRLIARAAEPTGRPQPLYLRAPDARTIAERAAAAAGAAST